MSLEIARAMDRERCEDYFDSHKQRAAENAQPGLPRIRDRIDAAMAYGEPHSQYSLIVIADKVLGFVNARAGQTVRQKDIARRFALSFEDAGNVLEWLVDCGFLKRTGR